ncbi:kti12, chromatin associated [Sporothrix stenoceras]|uniref:Kti12, chromatin associated n=1 Tax=Sporothrix stenoceras TaxID=5173 RepID=A0ABR3Z2R2_9PEZI
MPLIILSGLPTSGKSTRAKQLYDYLAERIEAEASKSTTEGAPSTPKYRLHLVSDDALSISRAVYDLSTLPAHTRSANASEKDARASIYGAVKRVLSPRDIVVLDGLNYIKGWRYQLACEAKNVSTTSAVLQIGCSVDRARQNNEERLNGADSVSTAAEPYSPPNWDNLVFRYEEPNPMTRWDSPLFALTWDDDAAQTRAVFDKLWDAVAGAGRKEVQPNKVTVQRGADGGGDFLYVLDRETQDVVKRILEAQKEPGNSDGEVRIPRGGNVKGDDLVVDLPGKVVGLPQLQRLRRAYMGLNRGGIGLEGAGGQLTGARIRESFVGYLNDAFEKDG